MNENSTVILVDDEVGMLTALTRLLKAENFNVRSHHSAKEFLAARNTGETACLVLDVAMRDINGMELQSRLLKSGDPIPIVFLTAFGDIPMSVRAIKSGAVDFLTKPVKEIDLFRAVRTALQIAETITAQEEDVANLRSRYLRLTPREREVMSHVVTGKPNKAIAIELGTGEQTIKIHRMRVMEKMRVSSLVELLKASDALNIPKIP